MTVAANPMRFKCPICWCPEYQRVVVPRERGAPYETEFLCCLGCSAMFIDPELFTAATVFRDEVDKAEIPRGAPEKALQSQSLQYRYWLARARRQPGAWDPTSEDVRRLRDRYRQ